MNAKFIGRLCTAALLTMLSPGGTQDTVAAESKAPILHSGAIEIGVSASLTAIEGTSALSLSTRGGTFQSLSEGLAGGEIELTYSHINSLDVLDLLGALSWQAQLANGGTYPFLSVGGGLRQEWLGSFRQARNPVGFNVGFRTLLSQHSAIRVDYRLRRILGDPVANFTEHQIHVGVSLLLRNANRNAELRNSPSEGGHSH